MGKEVWGKVTRLKYSLKKGLFMSNVFEIIMEVMFDAAMLALVVFLAFNIGKGSVKMRFTAALMSIGYLIYGADKIVSGGSYAAFVLKVLGFMLSYTAFVFTFSRE